MTLAELKRESKYGKIRFEMIERYGKTGEEIPERCRGIRTVEKVNSVAILLKNAEGKTSWKKREYFKNCPYPWLFGGEAVRGKHYTYNGKIVDNQVRGKAILKYRIYH